MLFLHRFFNVFSSVPGQGGRANGPPVLYQIRQNPYRASTVWGTISLNNTKIKTGKYRKKQKQDTSIGAKDTALSLWLFFRLCFLVGLSNKIRKWHPRGSKSTLKNNNMKPGRRIPPKHTSLFQKTSEIISISNSTLSASLWPDRHIPKRGAGGASPGRKFNK